MSAYHIDYIRPMLFEPYAIEMAIRLQEIYPDIVLELACNTGVLTRYLPVVTCKSSIIIATEQHPELLNCCEESDGMSNVHCCLTDPEDMPFEDELFDCVVNQFGVIFYHDRLRAFKETYRVLNERGLFVFCVWDEMFYNPVIMLVDEILNEFFPIGSPKYYKRLYSYCDDRLIRSELAVTGFSGIKIEILNQEGFIGNPEDAAIGLLEGTPVYNEIMDKAPALLPRIRHRLSQEIASVFGERDLKIPLRAKLVIAKKNRT
jgi:ubiquinone/menaquinone biosynthesis C-methylase UbiE